MPGPRGSQKAGRWAWLATLQLAAASWDYTGKLPVWRHSFPDFDCRRSSSSSGSLDWDAVRLQAEAFPPEQWRPLARAALRHTPLEELLEVLQDERLPECPFGVLFAAVVRYGECAEGPAARCPEAELLSEVVQLLLRSTSVEKLLGTRWPLLMALDTLRLSPYFEDEELSCQRVESPRMDWRALHSAFQPGADWFHAAKPLVYSRDFQATWVYALDECTYGFAMVALWKLAVCAETQAECVNQYTVIIEDLMKGNGWREVAGNSWRVFGFLARVQHGIRRHEFKLDFFPEELRGELPGTARLLPAWRTASPSLAGAIGDGEISVAFAGVMESVLAGVPRSYVTTRPGGGVEVRRLLYVTMVFGQQYVPYIPRFVSRAEALGITNLVLFCLDKAAQLACAALPGRGGGRCVHGTPSILNKFTLPLAYLRLGVDVFWLDFDVFLLRDPTPLVLETAQRRQVDLLVSGSFADDCICSGLVFFRATEIVAEWLLTVLSWMYEHVYTHDQQAFSAFLAGRRDEDNATTPERISSSKLFRKYLALDVPRWALLDPVVEFASARVLNTTGWTGDLDRMVIFHFLHGDSEVNRDHNAYGWNARHGFGTDKAILDVFYNQSDERIYNEAEPPQELSAEIRETLLSSRRPSRPAEMLHCGVLQLNNYTPGRMSADG